MSFGLGDRLHRHHKARQSAFPWRKSSYVEKKHNKKRTKITSFAQQCILVVFCGWTGDPAQVRIHMLYMTGSLTSTRTQEAMCLVQSVHEDRAPNRFLAFRISRNRLHCREWSLLVRLTQGVGFSRDPRWGKIILTGIVCDLTSSGSIAPPRNCCTG